MAKNSVPPPASSESTALDVLDAPVRVDPVTPDLLPSRAAPDSSLSELPPVALELPARHRADRVALRFPQPLGQVVDLDLTTSDPAAPVLTRGQVQISSSVASRTSDRLICLIAWQSRSACTAARSRSQIGRPDCCDTY